MTLRLPDDLSEQLRREAFERHVSQVSIITEALRAWFTANPATITGNLLYNSPAFQQFLQQQVQEAVERYGKLNPGNGTGRTSDD
jgi:hypothetical protein